MTRSKTVERMLPLYEAKMIHHFDHRWITYERDGSPRNVSVVEKENPRFAVLPRYWIREEVVEDRVPNHWSEGWFVGWRDIARGTDERTTIPGPAPRTAIGHTLPLMFPDRAEGIDVLIAALSSFALDYVARQKVGGTHLTYGYVNQFPVPAPGQLLIKAPWGGQRLFEWFGDRAGELIDTAEDVSIAPTESGSPFVWDDMRRELLRAELDAAFFHLYGVARDDVDYIMETFPIVKRKDVAEHGEYRTKRLILEIYDAMRDAIDTGRPYETIVDPPPGHGPRHPAKEETG